MSSVIPIKIAELAIENLNNEINQLKEEIARLKKAGKELSLKIHKSKSYSEFYPTLGEFEDAIGARWRSADESDGDGRNI
jgi:hypothetical protein